MTNQQLLAGMKGYFFFFIIGSHERPLAGIAVTGNGLVGLDDGHDGQDSDWLTVIHLSAVLQPDWSTEGEVCSLQCYSLSVAEVRKEKKEKR